MLRESQCIHAILEHEVDVLLRLAKAITTAECRVRMKTDESFGYAHFCVNLTTRSARNSRNHLKKLSAFSEMLDRNRQNLFIAQ